MASLVRVRSMAMEAARARVLEALAAEEAARLSVEKRKALIVAGDEKARQVRAWLDTEEAAADIGRAAQAALRRLAAIEGQRAFDEEALVEEERRQKTAGEALAAAQGHFVRMEQREKNARKRRADLEARWEIIVEEAETADAPSVRPTPERAEQGA
jgi:hypothetical protein